MTRRSRWRRTDGQGNVYVAGHFEDAAEMGGGTKLTSQEQSRDIFVASFTSAGAHRWSRRFGGGREDNSTAITVHGEDVFVVGTFAATAQLGPSSETALGKSDAFLLKLTAN